MEVIELEVEVINGNVLPVDPSAVLANETRRALDEFVRLALTAPAAIADDRHSVRQDDAVRTVRTASVCLFIAGLTIGLCANIGAFLF